MKEDKAIKELREEYKHRAYQLADAILALCDAKGEKDFASRDEVHWSDRTVHIMVFVDPKKKQRCRYRAKRPPLRSRPRKNLPTRSRARRS